MKGTFTFVILACVLAGLKLKPKKGLRKSRASGEDATAIANHRVLAAVFYHGKTICGGALYKDDIVLTTAIHVQRPRSLYKVKVFPRRGKGGSLVGVMYDVLGIKIHPDMTDGRSPKNNLAVMKLKRDESERTGLALDNKGLSFHAKEATLIGWGWDEDVWGDIESLKSIGLPIMPVNQCKSLHRYPVLKEQEFCAGYPNDNFVAYHLSQGSPLLHLEGETPVLLGLVSWAESYEEEFYPSVFVRISSFADWIRQIAGN